MKIFSLKTLGILVMVFIFTFSAGILLGQWQKEHYGSSSIKAKTDLGKPINVLIMGIDARGKEQNSRSDTMILASINPQDKKIAMVWIPRDTRIEVSKDHYEKINAVNCINGPEAACETVSTLLDTNVDYYAVANFNGFSKIVDTLGGVTIDVEKNMHHYDPDPTLNINLKKGVQKLNGADALRYVRFRGDPMADISRTGRQQKFIRAVAAEMFSSKTIFKLPQLIPELTASVRTNIPVTDMLYIANAVKNYNDMDIVTQTLPGYPYTDPISGASYWLADETTARGIIDNLLIGKQYAVTTNPPAWLAQERANAELSSNLALNVKEMTTPAPADESGTVTPDYNQPGGNTVNEFVVGDQNNNLPDSTTGSGQNTNSTDNPNSTQDKTVPGQQQPTPQVNNSTPSPPPNQASFGNQNGTLNPATGSGGY